MLTLLFFFLLALIFWFLTRAFFWVLYYFLVYGLIARVSEFFLGGLIDFSWPVAYWVSRLVVLVLTIWLGTLLRRVIARHPILKLLVAAGLIYLVASALLQPSHFFFFSWPGELLPGPRLSPPPSSNYI